MTILTAVVSTAVVLHALLKNAAPSFAPLSAAQQVDLAVAALGLLSLRLLIGEVGRSQPEDVLRKVLAEAIGPYTKVGGICAAVTDSDFYSTFQSQMKQATTSVDIMHLSPRPPTRRRGSGEKEYFDNLRASVRATKAHVRRLERVSVEKIDWIRDLVTEMKGTQNFDLAVFIDPAGDETMPMAMSVQRIDDAVAWIVAPAEHEPRDHQVRDILIRETRAVALLADYYKRMWLRSTVVMRDGVADEAALAQVAVQFPTKAAR